MTTRELQDAIIRLKREQDVCILAHAYQTQDIWEVADYIGDSYGLSVEATKTDRKTVLMCGVRFMAETVKMLSPDRRVLLSHPMAGCPMADQLSREKLIQLKKQYPGYTVVAYINTTTDLKREADVVVTSGSAEKIIRKLENDRILFVPDCNLGSWIASRIPGKKFAFFQGGCPVHANIPLQSVQEARKQHPDALVLVHPECRKEISDQADYVGSTTGILNYVRESSAAEFIIGTENSIVQHLQFEHMDRKFYPLHRDLVCRNMRLTTLRDVYDCLTGTGGEEILLPEETIREARACIDRMVELG